VSGWDDLSFVGFAVGIPIAKSGREEGGWWVEIGEWGCYWDERKGL
jgi:hypothetical protein